MFLYPSPLHYRVVPAALYDRACTIMLGTNTFLNGYARKANPYDFRSLRLLFAGAEKLQEATANTWARRFGVRILEGYGATECSPCISVNTPMQPCFGSAGPFPARDRAQARTGGGRGARRALVRPRPERHARIPQPGSRTRNSRRWAAGMTPAMWSRSIARALSISSGRLKRFAKVSGEMVSLTAVEEALAGAFPEFGFRCEVAMLSKPDEDRGRSADRRHQ